MAKDIPKALPKPKIVKSIKIDDPKIIELIRQKDEEVKKGREVSKEIDVIQKEIDELTEKEMKITAKVEPKELVEKGEKIKEEINVKIKELEEIAQKIREAKLDAIPKDMEKRHLKLNDKREKLEQKRNKIALKVQKIKDRMVPKIQKIVKPQLEEFEDLMTAELKDEVVEVEVFNHVDEWKSQWKAQQKNKEL